MAAHRPINMVSMPIGLVSLSPIFGVIFIALAYPHIKNYSLSYVFAQDCTHSSLSTTSKLSGPQPNIEVGFRNQNVLVLHLSPSQPVLAIAGRMVK